MARTTTTQLQSEIDRLNAENSAMREAQQDELERLAVANQKLRLEVHEARAAVAPPAAVVNSPAKARSRWWGVLSAFLIIIGLILSPAAVAANWAANELSNTDRFVATFGPLADDPAVQDLVADQIVSAIDEKLDVATLTGNVFDGVEGLGLPEKAAGALDLLRAPAVAGLNSLIDNTVHKFTASDAFANIWNQTLTISHQQLIATLNGDDNAAINIGTNGEIGIQLGPIIDKVKEALVKQGIGFASSIPEIDKTIVIAQADKASSIQQGYQLAIAAAAWLPWVSLAFLIVGVLVARRRVSALIGASVGLAVVMILLGSGLAIGKVLFVASVKSLNVPGEAAGAIYTQIVGFMSATTLALAVYAITIAVVAWLMSSFKTPRRLRGAFGSGVIALRSWADERGVGTGRFGEVLYKQRIVVRVVVAIIGAALVLFVRPITPGLIIWTAVIALVVLAISELLQRPVVQVPSVTEVTSPAAAATYSEALATEGNERETIVLADDADTLVIDGEASGGALGDDSDTLVLDDQAPSPVLVDDPDEEVVDTPPGDDGEPPTPR